MRGTARGVAAILFSGVVVWMSIGGIRREAERSRIRRDGVATTGLITRAWTRSGESTRYYLEVRFYCDGSPGPPRADFGMPPAMTLPPVSPVTGRAYPPEWREPPPQFFPPAVPGEHEAVFENGRMTSHPLSVGSCAVSSQFYGAHERGDTVAVKYLPSAPEKFVVVER